jgi:cytochrome c-type biogenesis protein CcmH
VSRQDRDYPQLDLAARPFRLRSGLRRPWLRHVKRDRRAWGDISSVRLGTFVLVALTLAYLVPLVSGAASPDIEAQAREIALQLRCPVCQGLSVGDSPSELANEMRTLVREQLQQGKTPAEVLDYFAQRYGEWILLAPPKRGFNLVIWVLPFALLPVGAAVIYLGARRWVRRPPAGGSPPAQVDSPYQERLQRELDSYQ